MLSISEAAYLAGIIDGEGTITLTKMNKTGNRRPIISIASTDKELLDYIQNLIGGYITTKKNYKPGTHKDSYVLTIKKKQAVFFLLEATLPFLRITPKKERAELILQFYDKITPRNGKYSSFAYERKKKFEENFLSIT
ncbi:LAGLIDADG family homing endonuclease [Halalkalibacter krulwichiae]|uniref:LAGLIDADG endonuclease n=1 Tax=Halalkalibacter krulwichiae TaxID=199441 RepID=A0A1X9MEZ1_9BACI|nr:LAGLIDADG family homing endonuclease [Halalkalibacter krulwichiae]ARK32008.1 LAGLIDADG endonuclease [Halalkalibacter krulwichiae]